MLRRQCLAAALVFLATRRVVAQQATADDMAAELLLAADHYVSIDGFDTHGDQKSTHADLLTALAESIEAFFAELDGSQHAERVVLMTFSEFGRRLAENDSRGTDHGAASNMFVIGPAVKGGLVGEHPSLARDDLIGGDPRFHTDFRQVYATLLDGWLGCDSRDILGGNFEHIDLLA